MMAGVPRKRLSVIGVPALAAVCAAASLAAATPAGAASARPSDAQPTLVQGPFFGASGTWTVPAGVTRIAARVGGSYGGNAGQGDTVTLGGPGDVVQSLIDVTPGQTFTVTVGKPGNAGCRASCSGAAATVGAGGTGFGNGGDGSPGSTTIGGGGGGSSAFGRTGATPVLVAAGGGGGGMTTDAQAAGSPASGNAGTDGDDGAIPSGSGGGGGGMPGGQGGTLGSGGHAGSNVGGYIGSNCTASGSSCSPTAGFVQLAYYEPGLDARDDSYAARVNTTLNVPAPGVLQNDLSFGLTPTLVRAAQNGAVELRSDGSFTYKPALGFVGFDSFTYAIQDSSRRAVATVTILVGRVAEAALTSVRTPGNGRLLLGLACGSAGTCPFDITLLVRVHGAAHRIAHGTSTYLPGRSATFAFKLPKSTRISFGTGPHDVVHATLYITLHRKGHPVIVIANRAITIK